MMFVSDEFQSSFCTTALSPTLTSLLMTINLVLAASQNFSSSSRMGAARSLCIKAMNC